MIPKFAYFSSEITCIENSKSPRVITIKVLKVLTRVDASKMRH